MPLWEVETDATGVVGLRDRRGWAEERRVLVLRGVPSASDYDLYVVLVPELWIERFILWVSDGGGPAGASKYDVRVNGATIYPGSAVDDQRPTIPFDATGDDLIHDSGIPEVRRLVYGDEIWWLGVQSASGGWPSRVELHLVCRAP